jgi:predicted ester cyclase
MAQSHASTIKTANASLLVSGELDRADEFFTPDYVAHITEQDLTGGPPAVRGFVSTVRKAFPDLEVEVEILVESGDRVAWQRTLRGTQDGSYSGFPATHRRIVWRDMVTSRLQDGRIAEEWVVTDLAERLLRARKG